MGGLEMGSDGILRCRSGADCPNIVTAKEYKEDAEKWRKYLTQNNFSSGDGDEYIRCINDKEIVEQLKKLPVGLNLQNIRDSISTDKKLMSDLIDPCITKLVPSKNKEAAGNAMAIEFNTATPPDHVPLNVSPPLIEINPILFNRSCL